MVVLMANRKGQPPVADLVAGLVVGVCFNDKFECVWLNLHSIKIDAYLSHAMDRNILANSINPQTYWTPADLLHNCSSSNNKKRFFSLHTPIEIITQLEANELGVSRDAYDWTLGDPNASMRNIYPYKYSAFLRSPWQNAILGTQIVRFMRLMNSALRASTSSSTIGDCRKYVLIRLILTQYVQGLLVGGAPRLPQSTDRRLAKVPECLAFLLSSPLTTKPTATWLLSRYSGGVPEFVDEMNKRFKLHLFEYTSPVCKRDKWLNPHE